MLATIFLRSSVGQHRARKLNIFWMSFRFCKLTVGSVSIGGQDIRPGFGDRPALANWRGATRHCDVQFEQA